MTEKPRYKTETEKEFLVNLLNSIYNSADRKQDFSAILISTIRTLEKRLTILNYVALFSNNPTGETRYLCGP